VKVSEDAPVDRKEAGEKLAGPLDAHDIGFIGRIVILYRRHPETPVIPLES
jgi:RNA-binding protein YhbY